MAPDYAVEVVIPSVPLPLCYGLTTQMSHVGVGSAVSVELGRRIAHGWVIKKISREEAIEKYHQENKRRDLRKNSQKQASKQCASQLGLFTIGNDYQEKAPSKKLVLKNIISSYPAFNPTQLPLFNWMADYYGAELADVIDCAIPVCQNTKEEKLFILSSQGKSQAMDPAWLRQLAKRAPQQSKIVTTLLPLSNPISLNALRSLIEISPSAITSLIKQNIIKTSIISHLDKIRSYTQTDNNFFAQPEFLTSPQKQALDQIVASINQHEFQPHLLYGVTGSGKTEVYIQAIKASLKENKTALVIVPEIALTPQLLDHFSSRLDTPIGVLHSQLGASWRWGTWQTILKKEVQVVIGARSAIFAPLENIGLIVVDEEHDGSYKQAEGFRYNGRDVAIMRAKLENCPVVLGSATPSFESLANAINKRYQLLELPNRATPKPLPEIEIINLNETKKNEMVSENISPQLYQAISNTLAKGEQIIVLYNRRGFSSYLQCESCGQVLNCPKCSVTLTYHKKKNCLLCHYCNYSTTPPPSCLYCSNPRMIMVETDASGSPLAKKKMIENLGKLAHRGGGTERVVDELFSLFPQAKIARMDRDTVLRKDAHRKILNEMRSGEANILVGTQMIAKGHDLPNVTLVGIIDADVALHFPDFRASEKTFQLLTQAAGRAGRGNQVGRVLIQTREPNHATIVATKTNRFKAFVRYELDFRKPLNYPPYGRLMRIIVAAKDEQATIKYAHELQQNLSLWAQDKTNETANNDNEQKLFLSILGPAPAALQKLQDLHRWHILVKSNSPSAISTLAQQINAYTKRARQTQEYRVIVDVDPIDML